MSVKPAAARDRPRGGKPRDPKLPPRRIDVLTGVTGVEFEDAWAGRVVHRVEELHVPFLGREALVRNKRATGRLKDLGDLEALGEEPGG